MPELVAERRAEPGPDLLSAMIDAADGESHLTSTELFANALFLMTAGHETATNGVSNGLLALLRRPDQYRALVESPDLIDSAVEEMLRFESPVQMTPRIAPEDCVVRGHSLRAGEALVVLLGAANRDPEQFVDAEVFDITRERNRHLAFGHGTHWCLGGNLARQEMRTVIGRFVAEYPDARLESEPAWQHTLNFHGPTELTVRLGP
jgi:cytochrome P450